MIEFLLTVNLRNINFFEQVSMAQTNNRNSQKPGYQWENYTGYTYP